MRQAPHCDFGKEQKAGGEATRIYEHFVSILVPSVRVRLEDFGRYKEKEKAIEKKETTKS